MSELSSPKVLLQRQVDEIEALVATFPEEDAVTFSPLERSCLEIARQSLEADEYDDFEPEGLGGLGGSVKIQGCNLFRQPLIVRFSFGKEYPCTAPRLVIECGGPRSIHEHLTKVAQDSIEEMVGMECLLMVLDSVREAGEKLIEEGKDGSSDLGIEGDESQSGQGQELEFGLRLIWFHHIKSIVKRKHIQEWSRELGLRGYCKPGYPGVIVCEGVEENVAEYVKRLRRLNWAAMALRGESKFPLANKEALKNAWHFKEAGFFELAENGMSDLSTKCTEAGLEDLFFTALKISKS